MRLSISADSISVTPGGSRRVDLDIDGVEERDLANAITIKDFLATVDITEVLDEIGVAEVKNYFNLTEIEE